MKRRKPRLRPQTDIAERINEERPARLARGVVCAHQAADCGVVVG